MTLGIMTLGIMTLNKVKFNILTLGLMTSSKTTFRIMIFRMTIKIKTKIQSGVLLSDFCAEWGIFIVMQNVVKRNVVVPKSLIICRKKGATTFCITTLSIMGLIVTYAINDTQLNNSWYKH